MISVLLCSMMLAGVELAKVYAVSDALLMDELESQRLGPNTEDDQLLRMENELEWLRFNGAEFIKMKASVLDDPYMIDGGHGMVATEDIEEGEILAKIPESLFFTVDNVVRKSKPSSSPSKMLDEAKSALLTPSDLTKLCLLHEIEHKEDEKSFWKPWLRSLDDFDPFPSTLSQHGLMDSSALLQAAQEVINFQRLNWQKSLSKFIKSFPEYKNLLQGDNWKLAAFLFEKHGRKSGGGDGKHQTMMLIPGLDLFQKRFGQTAWGYTNSDNCITIYSVQNIKQGNQIFIDGLVNKKNMLGRLQHSLSSNCFSWMGVVILPETPPVLSERDQSRFYSLPITPRNSTEGRNWYYTLTLSAPPFELINTVRMKYLERVKDGKLTAAEAEVEVLSDTISVIVSTLRNATREPNSNLRSLRRWLIIHRESNLKRRAVILRVMHIHVLTHNILLLGRLKQELENKISNTQSIGNMGIINQQSPHHILVTQYRLTFSLSIIAIRIAKLNRIREVLGKLPVVLPYGHFLNTFSSKLVSDLAGISDVDDLLKQMRPPLRETEDKMLSILKCDVLALLCRSMNWKDHTTVDQLLQLGSDIVSPDSLFSQGLSSRRRDSLHGHRLLHAAVMESDSQIIKTLLFYGSSTKSKTLLPKDAGDVALHYASKLRQVSTFASLEIMQLLLDADTAHEASSSGSNYVKLSDVEKYPQL